MEQIRLITAFYFVLTSLMAFTQGHPRIYVTNAEKPAFLERLDHDEHVQTYVDVLKQKLQPYLNRHQTNPDWIVSRLQMYWKTKYQRVYVKGMDFSHGEGKALVPTVRFSGSRDWDTDYVVPEIKDVLPFMDDERGLYLQNGKKSGMPWEWVEPAKTGHVIEKINKKILDLAQDAAFLYWLDGEEKYAVFATDIIMPYLEGMHHREPPQTIDNHRNKDLMGLQTFEVIHEGVIRPLTLGYDFLYDYLLAQGKDLDMIQQVFKKWAEQEIKYGVPDNNWNLMQARYISYLALALEDDDYYPDGKGQQHYIDQVLHQNSRKQKALRDVMLNFDPKTGIWPEVAHYSIMVSDDIVEVFSLLDKTLHNNLVATYPIVEKAILANFNYLYPNGYTTAYGDAKHARLRFRALELLIANYRKYQLPEKEDLLTSQLKRFIADGAYQRKEIHSLFALFFYVDSLSPTPAAPTFAEMVDPTFYSPNVSWLVQRNGHDPVHGMMVSKNASLGNHSHANGINIELFSKGMVIAPDAAAGVSYWSNDHKEYYSRFPAHNTVVVDGKSDYRTMNSTHDFTLKSIYPDPEIHHKLNGDFTFSDVTFFEPATQSRQHRLTGTVRTSSTSGYFVDIFRSARQDGQDKKHEYIFHGQGSPIVLLDRDGGQITMQATDELSSEKGDLVGYDYFTEKQALRTIDDFVARYQMPTNQLDQVLVNLWIRGDHPRTIFTVQSPYSRAIHKESVPTSLYHQTIPTLIVRQEGEAQSHPFVAIINAFQEGETRVDEVSYFTPIEKDRDFVGITISSENRRTDHIYNHLDEDVKSIFADGSFQGNYGIASFKNDQLGSILLGYGTLLEKGTFKITSTEGQGSVLVTIAPEYYHIDASVSFKLQLPYTSSSVTAPTLLHIDRHGSKVESKGKFTRVENQHYVTFIIPACQSCHWKIVD